MRRSADHEPIIEALAPQPGEHVLVKHRYSAFQPQQPGDADAGTWA